jgi:DNA-binding CsgD family transcriptional regulator
VLSHALNSVGTARATYGDARGFQEMERSLRVALENGLEEHAGRAYSNLGSVSARQYRLDVAESYLEAGLAYAADHDVDVAGVYMLGWQACLLMRRGRWNEATEVAAQLLRRTPLSTISRIVGLTVVGTLRARRGDPDVMTALDEALDLACPTGEVQRLGPLFAARAEAAWLAGDLASARAAARAGFDIAERAHEPWLLAELAYWRWRLGDLRTVPKQALGPYALQVAGRWREARAEWLAAGCPYEAAMASIVGDDAAVRDAFGILEELGATRSMNTVMRMLREKNSKVPRGPRPATRRNVAGLTQREREILELLAEGLRNVEIGERLSVSPRTVEHHVSAVLAKLGARSRVEAVAWARGIQRVPQSITQEVEGKYRYQHG